MCATEVGSRPPDIERIKQILKALLPKTQSDVLDRALVSVHRHLREYVDQSIARHALNQQNANDWLVVATEIASLALNDMTDLICGICHAEFEDDPQPAASLSCDGGTNMPVHVECLRDWLNSRLGQARCPTCRKTVRTGHTISPNEHADLLRVVQTEMQQIVGQAPHLLGVDAAERARIAQWVEDNNARMQQQGDFILALFVMVSLLVAFISAFVAHLVT